MNRFATRTTSRKVSLSLLTFFLGSTVAASSAIAQSSSSANSSSSADQSLNLYHTQGQNGGGYGNGGYKQYPKYGQPGFHHLAIEAGAGFDAPIGNTSKVQTFGYNIKLGAGYNFNRHFGVLAEYEFNRGGIPNSVVLANVGSVAQYAPQGNVHIWGLGLDPIYNYKTTGAIGGYVTGGAGFYRKLTSFTQPVDEGTVCSYYYGCYEQYGNQVISHFSSNQFGLNIGTGITHNIGEGGAKVYAEVRYLYVDSPKSTAAQVGSGTVSIIPVTFGIRF